MSELAKKNHVDHSDIYLITRNKK